MVKPDQMTDSYKWKSRHLDAESHLTSQNERDCPACSLKERDLRLSLISITNIKISKPKIK